MNSVLQIRKLRYRYEDGTVALNGVDLSLMPGETIALLGANGSGKTTLVLHLNGLLMGEGEITVCGLPVCKQHLKEIRRHVGIIFQDADEQLFMPTVLEDVAAGLLLNGVATDEARARALAVLDRLGMSRLAGKAPHHLSAGEKRRVAIAGVLAMNPELLVLDEPTTFLDPPGQRELLALLESLPQAKIIVTHDVGFARALATRAVFMEAGRIVADGGFDAVIQRYDWRPPDAMQRLSGS